MVSVEGLSSFYSCSEEEDAVSTEMDAITEFNPHVSGRELKKVKYYEEMFARMEESNALQSKVPIKVSQNAKKRPQLRKSVLKPTPKTSVATIGQFRSSDALMSRSLQRNQKRKRMLVGVRSSPRNDSSKNAPSILLNKAQKRKPYRNSRAAPRSCELLSKAKEADSIKRGTGTTKRCGGVSSMYSSRRSKVCSLNSDTVGNKAKMLSNTDNKVKIGFKEQYLNGVSQMHAHNIDQDTLARFSYVKFQHLDKEDERAGKYSVHTQSTASSRGRLNRKYENSIDTNTDNGLTHNLEAKSIVTSGKRKCSELSTCVSDSKIIKEEAVDKVTEGHTTVNANLSSFDGSNASTPLASSTSTSFLMFNHSDEVPHSSKIPTNPFLQCTPSLKRVVGSVNSEGNYILNMDTPSHTTGVTLLGDSAHSVNGGDSLTLERTLYNPAEKIGSDEASARTSTESQISDYSGTKSLLSHCMTGHAYVVKGETITQPSKSNKHKRKKQVLKDLCESAKQGNDNATKQLGSNTVGAIGLSQEEVNQEEFDEQEEFEGQSSPWDASSVTLKRTYSTCSASSTSMSNCGPVYIPQSIQSYVGACCAICPPHDWNVLLKDTSVSESFIFDTDKGKRSAAATHPGNLRSMVTSGKNASLNELDSTSEACVEYSLICTSNVAASSTSGNNEMATVTERMATSDFCMNVAESSQVSQEAALDDRRFAVDRNSLRDTNSVQHVANPFKSIEYHQTGTKRHGDMKAAMVDTSVGKLLLHAPSSSSNLTEAGLTTPLSKTEEVEDRGEYKTDCHDEKDKELSLISSVPLQANFNPKCRSVPLNPLLLTWKSRLLSRAAAAL